MRGDAKLLIEQQLTKLPLEELGFEEACEIAAGIRDWLYSSAFSKQELDAERHRVETAAHRKKEVETLGGLRRASRCKTMCCQQARQRAHAFCLENEITGLAYLSVLSDVESRLDVFITGDEPILEGQAIVRSVLESRFAEAEATLAAMRAKADAQWREEVMAALVLGTLVGLITLSLRYPEHTMAFFNWLERTFGIAPGAEAGAPNPEASETTSATASAGTPPRHTRRQKYPVAQPDPPFPCAPSGVAMQGEA